MKNVIAGVMLGSLILLAGCGRSGSENQNNSDEQTRNDTSNGDPRQKHPEILRAYRNYQNAVQNENWKQAIEYVHPESRDLICGITYLSVAKLLETEEVPGRSRDQLNVSNAKHEFRKLNARHGLDPEDPSLEKAKNRPNDLSRKQKIKVFRQFFSDVNRKNLFSDLVKLMKVMKFETDHTKLGGEGYDVKKITKKANESAKITLIKNSHQKRINMKKKNDRWLLVY